MNISNVLTFTNPGEIDPRLIRTFGANVKDSDSAIGFFGTGLKYALAGLLREGQEVIIAAGEEVYTFGVRKEVIRGKEFEFITMSDVDLGFTTELGKQWKPWQFYRELYCNALDEGGGVHEGPIERLVPGMTQVEVRGDLLMRVHAERDKYFILQDAVPLWDSGKVQVFPSGTESESKFFFKGIQVGSLRSPAMFRYNFLKGITLTEDRTSVYFWEPERLVMTFWRDHQDESAIRDVLLAPKGTFEHEHLLWDGKPGEAFARVLDELLRTRLIDLSPATLQYAKTLGKFKETHKNVEITSVQSKMLHKAREFLSRHHLPTVPDEAIIVVDNIGAGGMGFALVSERKILIAKKTFDMGTKALAGTIMEEALHLQGMIDYSRELQNWLVDKVISTAENVDGEPL